MLRRLIASRTFQVFSVVFLVLAFAAPALANEDPHSFWYHIGCILLEMCAVRHPFGHHGLFDWSQPATHAVALSVMQWSVLFGAVVGGVVARRRRS